MVGMLVSSNLIVTVPAYDCWIPSEGTLNYGFLAGVPTPQQYIDLSP